LKTADELENENRSRRDIEASDARAMLEHDRLTKLALPTSDREIKSYVIEPAKWN